MFYKLGAALAFTGLLTGGPLAAQAQSGISVNFVGDGAAGNEILTGETAGVVPLAHFNNDLGGAMGTIGGDAASGSTLVDSAGSPTGATVTYNAGDNFVNSLAGTSTDNRLMNGYIDSGAATLTSGGRATTTIAVAGIPTSFGTYSVYVYFFNSAATTGTYTIASTSGTGAGTTTVTGLKSFTGFQRAATGGSGNYFVFSGLTGTGFNLTATSLDTANGAPINGFQIVGSPAAAPEPAGFVSVLLGMALLGGLIAARRRTAGACA